ncbi:uncharacterized protein LOC129910044 [Episyrphus balteatus]|uniref:uncharacterized protein LOC129910044 n=1 Tax=Episyrphus balteatus TaxID=286459 RepID=UPI002484E0AE|nr:uncharacterized protein LOC129910044 [Episyrphus balteatus]
MLVKQFVSQALLLRNAGALSRAAYHAGGHHKPSTMNDLPVPEGDWQEHHSRQNSKYNAVLLTGILVLAGSIGFAKSSGIIFLNSKPPKTYE